MPTPAVACAESPAAFDEADKFLTATQTRARYGNVSDMWLWRRLHDGTGFPQPMVLGTRRYWRLSELVAWEKMVKPSGAAPK